MGFEVFDSKVMERAAPAAMVRVVTRVGWGLLVNRPAWALLARGSALGVHLLFDRDARVAGIKVAGPEASGSTVFEVGAQRSIDWPVHLSASQFVEHYGMEDGVFPATLDVSSGVLSFPVGPARGGRV